MRTAILAVIVLRSVTVSADEGLWTFNAFPTAKLKAKYGFEPPPEFFDHLRRSSLRVAGTCSASFVSRNGLVMTNHHCARGCVSAASDLAKTKRNYVLTGFSAATEADEVRCPGIEINQLLEIVDVTKRMQDATKDVAPEKFAEVQRATQSAIEKECGTSDDLRCEVTSLFRGGRFELHTFKRFQDVRLVFAPEEAIANFGGDLDNFAFPRYALDLTFLRVYDRDGKPFHNADHFPWSVEPLKEGDLSFVVGTPGGTSRSLTVSQLELERDVRGPAFLARIAEQRGLLLGYRDRGPEQKRHSMLALLNAENDVKSSRGRLAALSDRAFFAHLVTNEQDFRAKVKAKPELQKLYGGIWDAVDEIVGRQRAQRTALLALEYGTISELFRVARTLLRASVEFEKPNGERLREYTEARLPQLRQRVLSTEPIYDEFEIATLAWSLDKLREDVGPDHVVVKRVFGSKTALEVATAAVKGTKLKAQKVDSKTGQVTGGLRKELLDGGRAKVDASKDPMLELARAFDVEARAVRARYEAEVDGPLRRQMELLAKARFAIYGDAVYPDATFTPRISFGAVRSSRHAGESVSPFTTLEGAFNHHTGAEPFALPPSLLAAKSKLALETPFNLTTDNDVIGGNSGSPLINSKGEVIGLVFDINLQSLGSDFGFDEANNRTISVSVQGMVEVLDKVYGNKRLLEELGQKR